MGVTRSNLYETTVCARGNQRFAPLRRPLLAVFGYLCHCVGGVGLFRMYPSYDLSTNQISDYPAYVGAIQFTEAPISKGASFARARV